MLDPLSPVETSIYVQRGRYNVLISEALLQTNRQLRRETQDELDEIKKCLDLFILDVMVVQGVGTLPTWLHFPYLPRLIDTLRINVRIFRSSDAIPSEWREAGRYSNDLVMTRGVYRTEWNLIVLFTL